MHGTTASSGSEHELIEYLRQLGRNAYGWQAVHLHLSELQPSNRLDFKLRFAASAFDGLLRRLRSDLFQLSSGDLVYLWEGAPVEEVDEVVVRLRYLFSDDPLVQSAEPVPEAALELRTETDFGAAPRFCTWYELERDHERFRFAIEDWLERLGQSGSGAPGAARGRVLEPGELAGLEAAIATTDVEPLIRRQPVCAILPSTSPRPVFREVHIAITELGRQLAPGIDLTAEPWLFQHLAESLDRRLLAALAAGAGSEGGNAGEAISINLRLATLLSPDFLHFDEQFRRHHAGEVIVELQLVDIFAGLGAYLFIRDFVRERGYRICIDGLHHLHLPLISRKRIGADLVKLVWSPDVLHEVDASRHEALRQAIQSSGVDRVILCRCDSSEAVEWGLSLGIRLFQGHYVDSRLRAARSPAIAAARQALRQRTAV